MGGGVKKAIIIEGLYQRPLGVPVNIGGPSKPPNLGLVPSTMASQLPLLSLVKCTSAPSHPSWPGTDANPIAVPWTVAPCVQRSATVEGGCSANEAGPPRRTRFALTTTGEEVNHEDVFRCVCLL